MAGDPFSVSRKTWWRIGVPLAAAALLVAQLAWGNGPRREAAAVSRPGSAAKARRGRSASPACRTTWSSGATGRTTSPG